jgi:hypothetical protein
MDIIEFNKFKLDLKQLINDEISECRLTIKAHCDDEILNTDVNGFFKERIKELKELKSKVSQLKINQI